MGSCVNNGEEQHSVGDLPVEPDGLVERQKPDLGSDPSQNVPAHRENDTHGVHTQHQTRTTGHPHGELQRIEGSETVIGLLLIPKKVNHKHRVFSDVTIALTIRMRRYPNGIPRTRYRRTPCGG